MTGPEHYLEAEPLLETDSDPAAEPVLMARAQVHALLALAAATATATGTAPAKVDPAPLRKRPLRVPDSGPSGCLGVSPARLASSTRSLNQAGTRAGKPSYSITHRDLHQGLLASATSVRDGLSRGLGSQASILVVRACLPMSAIPAHRYRGMCGHWFVC